MKKLSLAILISVSLVSINASARSGFANDVPSAVPNVSENNCQTCHTSANGGASWNIFGGEIQGDTAKYFNGGIRPDWSVICTEDFDGDGATNGEELGDPDCTFPGVAAGPWVSNPADANSKPPVNNNNGTNNTTTPTNNATTAGNNGTTAAGNNGTTAAGNNGTTAAGNNGTTAAGNNGTGNNSNTSGTTSTSDGADDDGCSSTGSNPGQFSLIALMGLFFFGRKRRKN